MPINEFRKFASVKMLHNTIHENFAMRKIHGTYGGHIKHNPCFVTHNEVAIFAIQLHQISFRWEVVHYISQSLCTNQQSGSKPDFTYNNIAMYVYLLFLLNITKAVAYYIA